MVAGAMAMLKVALMVVLTTTPAAPCAGMVDTTVGTVTTSWPHPVIKATKSVAKKQKNPNL
jgi:hypothetical protein